MTKLTYSTNNFLRNYLQIYFVIFVITIPQKRYKVSGNPVKTKAKLRKNSPSKETLKLWCIIRRDIMKLVVGTT